MKVLALAGDVDATIADIRLRTPLEDLARRLGWSLQLASFHDCPHGALAETDVLVVQRAASARAWRLQRSVRERGGAVIYEIDDLLTEMAPHLAQYGAVRRRLPWLRRCMAQADVVTVSTRRLGEALGLADALVVPNYPLALGDLPLPPIQPAQPVTLFLASSDHLAADFIVRALRRVVGPRVDVVVVGPWGPALVQAGLPVRQQPPLARRQFVDFARSLPNPLAVIPLEDTRFASCKSAVKWFDYAEAGVPALCSAVSPYREVVHDGRTGALVPNDVQAWVQALESAVDDAAWRQRVAAAARADVRQRFTLEATSAAWQAAIMEAQRRRAALALSPLSAAWRVHQLLGDALEGGLWQLRRLNRARLARRSRSTR